MNDSPSSSTTTPSSSIFSRRNFLRSSLIAGTSAAVVRNAWAKEPSEKLQVALIGCGTQGAILTDSLPINQDQSDLVHVRAICDISSRKCSKIAGTLQERNHDTKVYSNAEEMFAAEGEKLDAVIVATPDFVHHTYAIMAMEAGCDVYCEKMMSNRIATARDIVLASQEQNTRHNRRRICQIGHQRRSNPRYRAVKYRLHDDLKLFGRLIANYAQWNRSISSGKPTAIPAGRARSVHPSDDILIRHGFTGGTTNGIERTPIEHYLNWRMFSNYGAGALSDLGAHQIDLFAWFLNTLPKKMNAQGGNLFFNNDEFGLYELADTAQLLYEFETEEGTSNCIYQVATTNGSQGSHERWLGTNGTILLGEKHDTWNSVYRDETITENLPALDNKANWEKAEQEGLIGLQDKSWRNFWDPPISKIDRRASWQVQGEGQVDVRETRAPGEYDLLTTFATRTHEPHLRNFFEAVQTNNPDHLNCPAEEGFKTTVMVLQAYEALATNSTIHFSPEDFVAKTGAIKEPGMLADSLTPAQNPAADSALPDYSSRNNTN